MGDELVEHELHRRHTGATGDGSDAVDGVGFVVDVRVVDRPMRPRPLSDRGLEEAAVVGHVLDDAPAPFGFGEGGESLCQRQCGDLLVRAVEEQRVDAALQAVQDPDAATGHLGRRSADHLVRFVQQAQHVAPHLGGLVGLVEVDADRLAGECRDLAHPRPLLHGYSAWSGANWNTPWPTREIAVAMPSSSRSSALVPGTSSPSFALWIGVRLVLNPNAPARSASSTNRAISPMSASVAGSLRAPIAHHVRAERAVADLGADVHHPWQLLEHVEVLGVALPTPFEALGERTSRNVLHALHQLDQPLVTIGRGGCEADATVAHDRRRDAVPTRRGDERIPGHLCVVVRVGVDEARRQQQTVGVEGAAAGGERACRLDGGDQFAVDAHVGRPAGGTAAVDEVSIADDEIVCHAA